MSIMNNCIFCKIIKKEIPGEVIYEDQCVLGILDINPCASGHTIIIPKAHAESILDISESEISRVFLAVKNVTDILNRKLLPDGFTIGINHGAVAGQAVPHFHVHIIPRAKNDGGGSLHNVVRTVPKESLQDIKKKILS